MRDSPKRKLDGVFCYFEGENSVLSCTVETFELLENANIDTTVSAKEYAELVIEANKFDGGAKTDKYGNVYFTYEKEIDGNEFTYFAYIIKTDDAFYTCNFICLSSQSSSFEEDFALWASSIEIK